MNTALSSNPYADPLFASLNEPVMSRQDYKKIAGRVNRIADHFSYQGCTKTKLWSEIKLNRGVVSAKDLEKSDFWPTLRLLARIADRYIRVESQIALLLFKE